MESMEAVDSTEPTDSNDSNDSNDSPKYTHLIGGLLVHLIGRWISVDETIERLFGENTISPSMVRVLVDSMNANRSLVREVLGIDESTLVELLHGIDLREKSQSPETVATAVPTDTHQTIEPTITECIECMVYEVKFNGTVYYMPTWQYQVSFDIPKQNSKLTVESHPPLPRGLDIDEDNNILIWKKVRFADLIDLEFIKITIELIVFLIPVCELYIRREQTYKFRGAGMPRVVAEDIYRCIEKSDIIVSIVCIE